MSTLHTFIPGISGMIRPWAHVTVFDVKLAVVMLLFSSVLAFEVFAVEPSFRVPEINVTVTEGEVAILPCSIQYLGDHKVVWTDANGFLLTLKDRRLIDDDRISVERPYTKDWNLHIRNVRYEDQGRYVCQINTTPVKVKEVSLIVLVPPSIIEQSSSADTTVREGDKVTLVCNATGVPQPNVTWFRTPNLPILEKERIGTTGEILIIHNVSRDCGGTYTCDADNGIGQPVRRQMDVTVHYPPEVVLPASRMGQYPNKETFLQCEVSANPHGVMAWSKEGEVFPIGDRGSKYVVEIYNSDHKEKKILSLRIRSVSPRDFGRYTCAAKNFLGEDKETMLLYDYSVNFIRPNTTTTPRPRDLTTGRIQPSINLKPLPGYDTIRDGNFMTSRPHNGENVGALGSNVSPLRISPSVLASSALSLLVFPFLFS